MAIFLTFELLMLACCSYAIICGGPTGRRGAIIFITASAGSAVATWSVPWLATNRGLFVIDAACWLLLVVLAHSSRRYWPIWTAGLQLISVATHAAMVIKPAATPHIYRALETFWAVPILLLMVAGITADRRAGLEDQNERRVHRRRHREPG